MSLGNANTNNNEVINKMRQLQASALIGRIREREKSGRDYIEYAGNQESTNNPMKTLKEDYDDKQKEWDKSNKLLYFLPLIGWAILIGRYKDKKDAEKAWGDKVKEERENDKNFVANFQQQFDKMTSAERNEICRIGEQFMNDAGFDMKKFIEDNKNLNANEQVAKLENTIREMEFKISAYQNLQEKLEQTQTQTQAIKPDERQKNESAAPVVQAQKPNPEILQVDRKTHDFTSILDKDELRKAINSNLAKGDNVNITQQQAGMLQQAGTLNIDVSKGVADIKVPVNGGMNTIVKCKQNGTGFTLGTSW